jgi:hypothetical protein
VVLFLVGPRPASCRYGTCTCDGCGHWASITAPGGHHYERVKKSSSLCKQCANTSPRCANTCCVNTPNQCANTSLNPPVGVPTLDHGHCHGRVRPHKPCVAKTDISHPHLDTGALRMNYLDTKAFLDSSRRALQHIKSCFFFFARHFCNFL